MHAMLRPCCGHADCNPAEVHLKADCAVQADGQSHSSPPPSEFPLLRSLFDVDLVLSRDARAAKRRAAAAAAATRKVAYGRVMQLQSVCVVRCIGCLFAPAVECWPRLLISCMAAYCMHTVSNSGTCRSA